MNLPNHLHLEIPKTSNEAEGKIILQRGGTVNWLNIATNKPGGKFKITAHDELNNEIFSREFKGNDTKRYGERLSLPITDSGCIIKVHNLEEGPSSFDVFLD